MRLSLSAFGFAVCFGFLGFAPQPSAAQDAVVNTAEVVAENVANQPSTDLSALHAPKTYGMAMHGDLKYAPDFQHFDYVNADAPKGGTLRLYTIGTFDSLNPFIIKGVPASSIGLIYETLTEHSRDEPFSEYGALAESIEMPEDRSWVAFNLHKEAHWQDGEPLTADDVVWTFHTLMERGAPFYKAYYAGVKDVQAISPQRVVFTFQEGVNMELPLIIGQLPVLPKHYWEGAGRDFSETTLTPPIGSGPYEIGRLEQGRYIEYIKDKNWWGQDIPINKGRYNFDRITIDYYRDATVAQEAFFADEYDFREENTAKTWATSYDDKAGVKSGEIIKEQIRHEQPAGMQGFFMNIRRPVFADTAVRKAVNLAFDFEWSNKQFAYGAYTRTDSYFENSELASFGTPTGRELEILTQFKDKLPPELFTVPYTVSHTDGSGDNRKNLRQAIKILENAGYKTGADGIRVNEKTKVRLSFEIIDNQPAFERWTLPFIQNLKKIGIEATFRVVDTSQYVKRLQDFDYDMTIHSVGESLSPGNEQRDYWHSSKADEVGSRNIIGISNPVVDKLIDMVVSAPSREELVYRTRALDRVLLWGYYVVPQWHINSWRVAYHDKFGKPDIISPQGLGVSDTWWMKAE